MMPLLALTASAPFPYAVVALVCVFAALTPPLYRYYSLQNWRIPLWHVFPLFLFIALLCLFLPPAVRAQYEVAKLYWLFDNGFYFGPGRPTDKDWAGLPLKLLPFVGLVLAIRVLVPATITLIVSAVVTKRFAPAATATDNS